MKPAPVFELLSQNSSILMADHNTLKTRDDRAIKAYLMNRTKRAAATSRTHNHTGAVGDSTEVTLSWTTKADKFSISLKQFDNNVYSLNEALANGFLQCAMNILEAKETEAIAYLVGSRATQAPAGLKVATFSDANDSYEITAEEVQKNRVFSIIKSVMRQNYFNGQVDVIVDPAMAQVAEFLAAQGAGNATNYGYQFGLTNIAESIELADSNYTSGMALAMPSGTACALSWIPKQNRHGSGDYNSYVGGFGVINILGWQFAVHGYSGRADASSRNGNAQDVVTEFELSLDTSFNVAPIVYNTDRTDSVVMQFGQINS